MKTRTAYSYLRYSTPEQALGDSERRQLSAAIDYCKRNGWTLSSKRFADRGVSAYHGKHREKGALKTLLETARPGELVILEDTDRWSRESPLKSLGLLQDQCRKGVQVYFSRTSTLVTEDNFEDDAVLLPNFLGAMLAHNESKKKAERIQAGWDERRAQARAGKAVRINRLACWLKWDVEADKVIVDESKAKVVHRVFELARAGHTGLEIVQMFRKEKMPSVSSQKGAEWNTVMVRRILSNKAVMGCYTQVEPAVPNVWPAIIDEALFHAVQREVEIMPSRPGAKSKTETNLFTGLALCGCCNRFNLNSHIGGVNGTPKLICQGGHRGQTDCGHTSVPIELVENSCLSFLASADLIRPLLAGNQKPSRVAELHGRLTDAQKQVTKLTSLIMSDSEPSPTLYAKLKEQERSARQLQSDLEEETARERVEKPASIAYGEFVASLPALKADKERRPELRKAVAQVVERLVLDPRPINEPKKLKAGQVKAWGYRLYLRGASDVPVNFTICKNGDWASDVIAKLDMVQTQKMAA